jgi:Leucine-rich repeat (LRR) protein
VTLLTQKSKNTPCTEDAFSNINLKSLTFAASSISNPGLFLNNNYFSGDFLASISCLHRLKVVDLSGNEISGQIPDSLLRRLSDKIPLTPGRGLIGFQPFLTLIIFIIWVPKRPKYRLAFSHYPIKS